MNDDDVDIVETVFTSVVKYADGDDVSGRLVTGIIPDWHDDRPESSLLTAGSPLLASRISNGSSIFFACSSGMSVN